MGRNPYNSSILNARRAALEAEAKGSGYNNGDFVKDDEQEGFRIIDW